MNDLAYSDALKELYLEHHGVKGQKWGVRRTPQQLGHKEPGRLSKMVKRITAAKKKSKKKAVAKKIESDEEIRAKVLRSVDPKYIYKHRALLDDRELQGRIDRINKEATLKKLAEPEGQLYKKAQSGKNWIRTAADMTKSVSDIYTSLNVIVNVGGKKDKDKKDKDKKDKDKKDDKS